MHSFKAKLLLLSFLTGCSLIEPTPEEKIETINYYKDSRTNLCFVENHFTTTNGFSGVVFSHVPCTPEVEVLIKTKE